MKDTGEKALLQQAIQRIIDDMHSRDIGAVLWNVATAGFHFIPEIVLYSEKGEPHTVRVTGIYRYHDRLYAIEEDAAGVSTAMYYRKGVDVPPTVVTLTEDKAREELGDPETSKGFTDGGTVTEWLTIADCYFEALSED